MNSREALVALNMVEHVGPVELQQLLERHISEASLALLMSRFAPRRPIKNQHGESMGPARHCLPDPTHADDAQRRSVNVRPEHIRRMPPLKFTSEHYLVPIDEAPSHGR